MTKHSLSHLWAYIDFTSGWKAWTIHRRHGRGYWEMIPERGPIWGGSKAEVKRKLEALNEEMKRRWQRERQRHAERVWEKRKRQRKEWKRKQKKEKEFKRWIDKRFEHYGDRYREENPTRHRGGRRTEDPRHTGLPTPIPFWRWVIRRISENERREVRRKRDELDLSIQL